MQSRLCEFIHGYLERKMRKATVLIVSVMFVVSAGFLHAQEVPLEQIQASIVNGAEMILGTQQDDGAFLLTERHHPVFPLEPIPIGLSCR